MTVVPQHHRRLLPQRRYSEMFELTHGGKRAVFHVTLGRYPDGSAGEVFIAGGKAGSELEASLRDCAIMLSISLQYGVPLATIASAITREGDGSPSSIVGSVIDKLVREETL